MKLVMGLLSFICFAATSYAKPTDKVDKNRLPASEDSTLSCSLKSPLGKKDFALKLKLNASRPTKKMLDEVNGPIKFGIVEVNYWSNRVFSGYNVKFEGTTNSDSGSLLGGHCNLFTDDRPDGTDTCSVTQNEYTVSLTCTAK